MEYTTIYDFVDESPRFFHIIITLILVVSGYGGIYYEFKKKRFSKIVQCWNILFLFFVGTASLWWGIGVTYDDISMYRKTKFIYTHKQYMIIEGAISSFTPMPFSGHAYESFEIEGVKFKYSDYEEIYYGFNHTKSHWGPLGQGMSVRITYYKNDERNIILKLEKATVCSEAAQQDALEK